MTALSAHCRPLSELAIDVARSCLDRLDNADALADETVVHEIRVATKRLRAAWHLVSAHAGRDHSKKRRRALSALSAKLSGARDLSVLTRLVQHLAATQTDGRIAIALDHVVEALVRRHDEAAQAARLTSGLCEEIRSGLAAEIAAWEALAQTDHHAHRRSVRHQLRRSLNHARRDTREAVRSLDSELWHDWRKAVKRLRYQREFIATTQGREPGHFDARVHRLGSRLGDRNDLANLAEFADAQLASGNLAAADHGLVRKAIAAAESGIIRNCRRVGRLIFLR